MKYRFQTTYIPALILLAILSAFLLYSYAGAEEQPLYYTIQAGSYLQEDSAVTLYHSLAQSLGAKQRDHLRIEKVGRFFAVRLGRFTAKSAADKLLAAGGRPLAGALVLKAYIKPERISLLYGSLQPAETAAPAAAASAAAPKIPQSGDMAVKTTTPSRAQAETDANVVRTPGDLAAGQGISNISPTLAVNQPDGVDDIIIRNALYTINYDLADPDDKVSAAFFYDTDNRGLNGTAIAGGCAAAFEGNNATCIWDTSGVVPGIYYIYGLAADGVNPQVSSYSSGTVSINAAPVLAVHQPGKSGNTVAENGPFNISYDLADPDDAVSVAFFYDTDSSGLDGTAIAGDCSAAIEGIGATCTWDSTGIPSGAYYIYGLTDDGINAQVSAYSSGPVTFNASPVLAVHQPDESGNTVAETGPFNISYDLADPDDAVSVAFFYDTDSSGLDGIALAGACTAAPEGIGASCGWDTTGVAPGTYYIYGLTDDGINAQVSAYSPGPLTIDASPDLAVNQPDGVDDIIAANGLFSINYDLEDADGKLTVAFYYDTDASGLDGIALAGTCSAAPEGIGTTCAWDTSGVAPGVYYIYGLTDDGINPQVSAYSPGPVTVNAPPVLAVNRPHDPGGTNAEKGLFAINYDLADPDDEVTVTFYYDTDNSGQDGTVIAGDCSGAQEGSGSTCTWDLTGVTPGAYYVYGITDDGTNPQVSMYSAGPVVINVPPVLSVNQPDDLGNMIAQNGPFRINYDLADPDDAVSVAFYYDADNNGLDGTAIEGPCAIGPEGAGTTCTWDTTGVAPGSYYIYGITADSSNPPVSQYSRGQVMINGAPTLTVIEPSRIGYYITAGLPLTIKYNLLDPDDTVNVAFYYDTDKNGFDGIPLTGGCAAATPGSPAECTWNVSELIPHGTYYIYGLASDNINPQVSAYAPGPVIIDPKYKPYRQPTGLEPIKVVKVIDRNIFGEKYHFPSRVFYDSIVDEIYVIGGGSMHPSSKVTVFGPDYFPVASFGKGRGAERAADLVTSKAGDIYMTIYGENPLGTDAKTEPRIIVFNGAFFVSREISFRDVPKLPEDFQPDKISLGRNGKLYLNTNNGKGVMVLDTDGNFLRWIVPGYAVRGREAIGDDPEYDKAFRVTDVEVDQNGRIYIVCFDVGRVFVLDPNEDFLFAFGQKGGSSGKLSQPMDIAVDIVRQAIYVVDYMRHSINIYDYRDGHFMFEIGGMGKDAGWLQHPTGAAVDNQGNLIIADYFNHRIQVWTVP